MTEGSRLRERWRTRTPVRLGIENFLRQHATNKLALEVGAENLPYDEWFTNRVAMNVVSYPHHHVQADAHCLPFSRNTFEVVVCTEVLEHLHTPHLALNEMRRVLKPGGKLLLTTPLAYPIHDAPIDYFRFTRYGLTFLLRDWRIEQISESTGDGATMATLFHYWLFQRKGLVWKIPKLLWWCIWLAICRSYLNGKASVSARPLLPTGYLVVARKPLSETEPANTYE